MQDLLYLLLIVGFFAVAAALVTACDGIVGPQPAELETSRAESDTPAEARDA